MDAKPSGRGVYRGKEPLGDVLRRMASDGRAVIRGERSRWQENRMFFRGEQSVAFNTSINALSRAPADPNWLTHDTVNRLRQFTEGRVNMMTREKPPFEVEPEDRDQDSMDAARQAERFLEAMWGTNQWDVQATIHELAIVGEVDGVAALYVNWDPMLGQDARVPVVPPTEGEIEGESGVVDRGDFEAAKLADPEQRSWGMLGAKAPLGDVCFRVVRMGALAVDPFAITDPREARWVIESRVRPKDEIELKYGKTVDELVNEHKQSLGGRPDVAAPSGEGVVAEDDDINDKRSRPRRDQVIVHCAYIRKGAMPAFPDGGYVEWLDQAPGAPLKVGAWEDDLPYFFFVPKPDKQNWVRSRGTVDDLKPLQRRLNRTVGMLGRWLDRVGNPPLVIDNGSLASKSIYSEEGAVFVHPGMERPGYLQTPGEPTAILSNWLVWIENQMAEIANLPPAARGQSSPGVDAASHFQAQAQQAELALAGPEFQLRRAVEWACSRALKLVGRFYVYPRLVATPGADDTEEIRAFVGASLRGCHRMRVRGSMLPRSRAAEIQTIMGFAPIIGPDIKPWVAQMVRGDLSEYFKREDAHRMRARRENRQIAALALDEKARLVYQNFKEDLQVYGQAVQMAVPMAQAAGMSPMEFLDTQKGIKPPKYVEMLKAAGVKVPSVQEFDLDEQHVGPSGEHDLIRVSDGYEKWPEHAQQALREHVADHNEKTAMRAAASQQLLAQPTQQGSAPAEKGTPSPPKQPGAAQGPAPMLKGV